MDGATAREPAAMPAPPDEKGSTRCRMTRLDDAPFDRRDLVIAFACFVLALSVNLWHVASTEFHRDEARWIHRARFLGELGDPLGDYWRDRDLMRGQPPLGSYLMGIGLAAQGRSLETNALYNFNFGERWNRRHGAMPTAADLAAARRTNAVVGALIAVCAYGIGRRLAGRAAGVVAAAVLAFHPLSIYLSSLAGSDAILTLAVAAAAWLAMALAARPTWVRALGLGVVLGLGAAAKLSPLLLALPLAALGVLYLWLGWRGRRQRGEAGDGRAERLGWRLLPLPLVAVATFVASYPYLWPDPIGRTWALFGFRAQEMENQGLYWPELEVTSRADALGRVGNWLGEKRSTTGSVAGWLAGRVGIDWQPGGIDLLLALAGTLILVVLVVRRGLASPTTLAAVVLGGQTALIVLGMRADFERYLYPVLLAVAVCVGVLGGALAAVVEAAVARRRRAVDLPEGEVGTVGLPRQAAEA